MDNCTIEIHRSWNIIQGVNTFRDALLKHLDETGVSVADLAKNAEVSAQQIYKIKQGKSASTNVDDAIKIAGHFGKTVEEMVYGANASASSLLRVYSKLNIAQRVRLLAYAQGLIDAGSGEVAEPLPTEISPDDVKSMALLVQEEARGDGRELSVDDLLEETIRRLESSDV